MPTFRTAEIIAILLERPGLQRVLVEVEGRAEPERAYVLTQLTGTVTVGDMVICNTTALELGLGTGGSHVVHWNLSRSVLEQPGPDHIMKLRYTSAQFDAGTSELDHPDVSSSIGGVPVVVCGVHSQVGVVAAVLRQLEPSWRITYVMTDGAALPMVVSDLVHEMVQRGILDATVTAGHAFGGDLEAVSIASGIVLGAHVARSDVLIVGMGPGVVGTGSPLGTTAVEVASIVDTVDALGGTAVMCVRRSGGDRRDRHSGLSHHSLTAARLARSRPWVAEQSAEGIDPADVRVHRVAEVPDAARILDATGLRVTTMGRGPSEDPEFFASAAAAAKVAAELHGAP